MKKKSVFSLPCIKHIPFHDLRMFLFFTCRCVGNSAYAILGVHL